MSLEVYLISYKGGSVQGDRIVRASFRGVSHLSKTFEDHGELSEIQQSISWPIASQLQRMEEMEIQVMAFNRFLNNRLLGYANLSLQRLLDENHIQLAVSLLDVNGRPLKATLMLELRYRSPLEGDEDSEEELDEDEDEEFIPNVGLVSRKNKEISSDNEGGNALINLEENITRLEQSILSNSAKNGKHQDSSQVRFANMRRSVSENEDGFEQKHQRKKTFNFPNVKKRPSNAFRSVKQAFRFGRLSRSSSIDDDQKSLMGNHRRGSGMNDYESTDGGMSSDVETGGLHLDYEDKEDEYDGDEETRGNGETRSEKKKTPRPKPSSDPLATSLKAQDFQVCVRVIEARQLAGLNMDPVVCVQVGDEKNRKYTSVKESTNCPYYDEYFVFDFHMAPVMLFDKIITLSVLQRHFLRSGKVLGTFKLDVATVMAQPDHQFYHKWALLTDPDDITGGPKGYLKCDISVVTKGDPPKPPPKSERDEDDIEANLLLPDGVPAERQRAKYIVRIYRADGLPKMNSSIMANLKHAFGSTPRDLVDPYVQVSFAGLTGKTSVKKNSYSPVWNEQIVFTEMFPPLCQRIKIQLRESDAVGDTVIGTHFLDLSSISNDGDKGFVPTFGPAFIHLYGSTRDYNFIDEHSNLNDGLGEGVSYRGRIMIALKTDISDSIDTAPSEVEVMATQTINEAAYGKREEFYLFGCVMEATMIDKKMCDRGLQIEVSCGNAGNTIDGQLATSTKTSGHDTDSVASGPPDDASEFGENLNATWISTTPSVKALSHDRQYYFLPYWDDKPTMWIRATFPDHRRRMYNSNVIAKITDKLDEQLKEVHNMIEMEEEGCDVKFKSLFEQVQAGCNKYNNLCRSPSSGLSAQGKTRLDRERAKMCQAEMESIGGVARQYKGNKKASVREKYKMAQALSDRLKRIMEDPQHGIPDIFVWVINGSKRLAYQRIPARHLLFSMMDEEKGKNSGTLQTLFLKLPGKKGSGAGGWMIQAKLQIYLWLGSIKHKKNYPSGLPPGFQPTNELLNAERPGLPPPTMIHYSEKHFFQVRAHMYQARSLIGSDASGLSDPFARVIIGEYCKTTQVIDETLSPTWDELLVFTEILVYGRREDIKTNPPSVIIEIYDQDKVGKAEFLGRAIGKPNVLLCEEDYKAPSLEWFQIYRGTDEAGELLAAFEMFELSEIDNTQVLPPFPPAKDEKPAPNQPNEDTGPILPVPIGIRPTLAKYRFEVLFWGLRDLKRVHWLTVDKPRVDIECAGHIIQSSVIMNAKRNPNFSTTVKFLDIELPEQEIYCPPLTIRVVDCRSFGRFTLVGTHVINSIHKFLYQPVTKRDREAAERKKLKALAAQRMATKPPGYSRQKSVPDVRLKSDGVTAKEGRPKSSAESLVSGLAKVATYGQLQVPQDVLASSNGSEATKSSNTFEMSPLLTGSSTSEMKDSIITLDYGTYAIPRSQGESSKAGENITSSPGPTKMKQGKEYSSATTSGGATDDSLIDDDEESMDWWTKYFASVDAMIEICPEIEPDTFDTDAALKVLDSSLTPSALKKMSKSVMDLSTMSEMKELSKSTSNLMTGGISMPKFKKKRPKSDSKASLLRSSQDSLSTISEGKEKRKESKKDHSDENEEEIQKAPEEVKKKSTGGFTKSMHKTFGQKFSPKAQRKKIKASVALMKVFPNELENQKDFDSFTEWLQTFELYRGKQGEEGFQDEARVVGQFKGSIKIFKLPLPKDLDDHTIMGFDPQFGMFQGLPSNDPLHVLVRVYVVKANDLHPMDINGKADPYLVLQLGSKRTSDKDNYVSKQLNPIFGKCIEFEATFPQDSVLNVQVYDWDLLGSDDLIGETKIDLENRFYSRHRATTGLATRYDPCGYNQWRDPMKPVQILTKLCKEGKLDGPHFSDGKVRVGEKTFTLQKDSVNKGHQSSLLQGYDSHNSKMNDEHLALAVLHHWHEIPRIGTHLVPEHIETRALFNPDKPGIEQGKIELWVDMFPMDMPLPGLPVDVSPRKPSAYELRCIIWNTDEVVLEDDAFFSGDKMSDIYVKGWLKGPDDAQSTDVHYRSLTGEGNFNWRFLFPFQYLAAEEKVVISKKESMFSWDETTSKVPARLTLQVWDADHFSKDDFLGAITLDLNRFPRGAKTVKQCTLDMLKTDGSVPMINLFKQKRTKGWWPMYIKTDNEGLLLQGKVEAEFMLLTVEEAEKNPAGLGREEPDALEKPVRPDSSFMWFLNPIKSIRYIIWHNYKWTILKIIGWLMLTIFLILFFYSLPGYTIKKMLGA